MGEINLYYTRWNSLKSSSQSRFQKDLSTVSGLKALLKASFKDPSGPEVSEEEEDQ